MIFNQDFSGVFATQCKNNGLKKFYQRQIEETVAGKTVVDLGAGTGILTFMAVSAGAKKVYAVEKNTMVCRMLVTALKRLGWQDKVVVVNKDFLVDDLTKELVDSDICLSETINESIYNNVMPHTLIEIKRKHPHLSFIPDSFSWNMSVVASDRLDALLKYGYDTDQFNDEINAMVLSIMPIHPVSLPSDGNIDPDAPSQLVLAYKFNQGTVDQRHYQLPSDRRQKWLKIGWHLEDGQDLSRDCWQYEYVCLEAPYFDKTEYITLEPQNFYHRIKSLNRT
jgi:hypothetical protein